MKFHRCLILITSIFFILSCAKTGTYLIPIQYQPKGEFPSLRDKIGPSIGIAPFKDERPDRLYIGMHTPLQGVSSYFKSEPFPLERAIMDSISKAVSRSGLKAITIEKWDGKPESLKRIEADSVLMVEIKRFWTEGKAAPFRTGVKTSVHFLIHLGVKREVKVFTRNVEVEKEVTLTRLTPEKIEEIVNKIISDIFDSFFSNPYEGQ